VKAPWSGEWHHLDGFTEQTLGLWFTVIGVAVTAGAASVLGWLAAAFIALFAIGGAVFGAYGRRRFRRAWQHANRQWAEAEHSRALETGGEPGHATIVSAATVGEYGSDLRIRLVVSLERPGHAPVLATIADVRCDPLDVTSFQAGRQLDVRFDPENPEHVVLPERMVR
jgi:hypothetical protein